MNLPEVLVAEDRNTTESKTNYYRLDNFTSADGCSGHAVLKINTKLHGCTVCDYKSTNSRNVRRHMLARHGIEVEPTFRRVKIIGNPSASQINDYCLDDSTSADGSTVDAVPKNNTKSHECTVCDYKSTNTYNLDRHMLARHGLQPVKRFRTNPRKYECNLCEFKTRKEHNLKIHQRTHIETENRYIEPLKIIECLDDSTNADGSPDKATPKNKVILLKCVECDYKSTNSYNVQRHMLSHHGIKPKPARKCIKRNGNPLECDICDFKTTREAKLKIHLRKHTGEKPYGCDICGKKTTTQGHLREHMLIHTGEKRFKCDLCDYKANQAYALQAHKLKHTGQKPFECDMCDYKSIRIYNLNSHKLTHTKAGKIYKCELCSYETVRQTNLNSHKLTHATVKRFACDECPHKTMLKSSLKKHKESHNRKKQKLYEKQFKCVVVKSAPPSTSDENEPANIGEIPLECVIKIKPIEYLDQNIN